MVKGALGVILAFMSASACAAEQTPIQAQKGIELWQRYCMSYSQDYRDIARFFKTFDEFEEVEDNWFVARKVAFTVRFMMFEEGGRGPCMAAFSSVEPVQEVATLLEKQIYALDTNAYKNREGQFHFVLMASRFTVIPSFDASENIVSLTLIRE